MYPFKIIKSFREFANTFFKLIPISLRPSFYLLIIILVSSSLLELFGISLLIPFFQVSLNPEKSIILSTFFKSIGVANHKIISAIIGLLIILFFLLKTWLFKISSHRVGLFASSIYRHYSNISYRFMNLRKLEGLKLTNSNYIIRDIEVVPNQFAHDVIIPIVSIIAEFMLLLSLLFILIYIEVRAVILLLALLLPPFIVYYNSAKNKLSEIAKKRHSVTAYSRQILSEAILGQTDIRIYNRQEYFYNRYLCQTKINAETGVDLHLYKALPSKIIETTLVTAIVLLFLYAVFSIEDTDKILALITIFGVSAFRIMPSANRMLASLIILKSGAHLIPFIAKISNQDILYKKESSSRDFTFANQILFKNVTFKYQGTVKNVVDNLNIIINSGEIIALVGRSGAGKSTFLNLFLGLLKPNSGTIHVDGNDLNTMDLHNWWKNLGYVQQDVFMLDGSIAENIKLDNSISEEDEKSMLEILKWVDMHEFVISLPLGVHNRVGERASLLSGGQKQRLAIARALFWKSRIILYDEATSAVDAETEASINKAIYGLKKQGVTQIIVSHKESILAYADKVYLMEEGKLKEK